jgi:hypothetical protein
MKDAHGEKSSNAPSPATKTAESPQPVAGTESTSIDVTKLGPPPPLVPIRPLSLQPTTPAPAAVVAAAAPSTPKPVSKLPTAAQVLSGLKMSPQTPVVRSSPLIAGKKIVQLGNSSPTSIIQPFKCQVNFFER